MISFVRTADAEKETPNLTPPSTPVVDRLDKVGSMASFLCAIHCAVMPLIVTLLPLFGLSFLSSEPVEWALLGASALFGVASVCLGFREHRSRPVLALVGVAIGLLLLARLFGHQGHDEHGHEHAEHSIEWLETGLMVSGGVLMMSAHFINQKLCRACRRCSSHECH